MALSTTGKRGDGVMLLRCRQLLAALALIATAPLSQAQTTVEYIHTDALGSVVAVTDANRNVIERREYEPYGAQLTPAVKDGPGYTGHVQDAATGLVQMQQRYYDPAIGRFLSVDPVTAYDNPVGAFNRYWYANNNPYKFTDPDGRCPMPGSGLCGKTFETIVAQSGHGGDLRPPSTGPVSGSGWSRPSSHPYVVGRAGTIVPPGPNPGRGRTIEDKIPAMHTMGTMHDNLVDSATRSGIPDLIVNIPTMPMAYGQAVLSESANSSVNVVNRVLGTNMPKPFEHTHSQSSEDQKKANESTRSSGFQGVFRVEGRIDSKRLDEQLKGK